VIGNGNTSVGETWNCTVIPTDIYQNGTAASDKVVIGNTAPGAPVIDVTPNLPHDYHNLTCNVTTASIDPDPQLINYTFFWFRNGTLMLTIWNTDQNISVLGAGNTSNGDLWNCTVMPYDGIDYGSNASDAVIVGNLAPTADAGADQNWTAALPFPVQFNATNSTDPENDTLTYSWDNGMTGAEPIYNYNMDGTYVIVLTVNDSELSDTDTIVIRINDNSSIDDNSTLINSTIINSTIFNSTKIRSVIIGSNVSSSTNYDSNLTNVNESNSYLNNSLANDSTIIDSTKIRCIISNGNMINLSVNYNSTLNDVNEQNSRINDSIIISSDIFDSELSNFNATNCTIISSMLHDGNCSNSRVENVSYSSGSWFIDPSTVINSTCYGTCIVSDSTVINSIINNSNVTDSNISSNLLLGLRDLSAVDANITDEMLYSGNATYSSYTYSIGSPLANPLTAPWTLENIYYKCGDTNCTAPNVIGANNSYPSCYYDCTACGDGICNMGETTASCAADCPLGISAAGGGGGARCRPEWICADWSRCISWTQTRDCYDANVCGTLTDKPATEINCSCVESWVCAAWAPAECNESRKQTRACYDENLCGTSVIKPMTEQECEYAAPATCFDRIKNQNEEEVDCGGVCAPCIEIPFIGKPGFWQVVLNLFNEYFVNAVKKAFAFASENISRWYYSFSSFVTDAYVPLGIEIVKAAGYGIAALAVLAGKGIAAAAVYLAKSIANIAVIVSGYAADSFANAYDYTSNLIIGKYLPFVSQMFANTYDSISSSVSNSYDHISSLIFDRFLPSAGAFFSGAYDYISQLAGKGAGLVSEFITKTIPRIASNLGLIIINNWVLIAYTLLAIAVLLGISYTAVHYRQRAYDAYHAYQHRLELGRKRREAERAKEAEMRRRQEQARQKALIAKQKEIMRRMQQEEKQRIKELRAGVQQEQKKHYAEMKSKYAEQLSNFIADAKAKRLSSQEVHNMLVAKGWPDKFVDRICKKHFREKPKHGKKAGFTEDMLAKEMEMIDKELEQLK
jgi:hypothetical protein